MSCLKPTVIYLVLALAMAKVGTNKETNEHASVKSLMSVRDGKHLEKLGVPRRDILKLMKIYGVMVTPGSDHSLVDLVRSLSEEGVEELAGLPGEGLEEYFRGLLEKGQASPTVKR